MDDETDCMPDVLGAIAAINEGDYERAKNCDKYGLTNPTGNKYTIDIYHINYVQRPNKD